VTSQSPGTSSHLREALCLLQEAIALLDAAEAPPNIAAHADLARHQLEQALEAISSGENWHVASNGHKG
jgi:hypothetical protein